jgi:hypothetical protein
LWLRVVVVVEMLEQVAVVVVVARNKDRGRRLQS